MIKSDQYATQAREAGVKVRHIIDGAGSEVSHVAETVEARINEKPVQSTLVALAAGLFVGLLLGRR